MTTATIIVSDQLLVRTLSFEDNAIRTVIKDGEMWWVAADVCRTIGIKTPQAAYARLDDDEKGVVKDDSFGGSHPLMTVNESGLYKLILRSNLPKARTFRKWITSEVLPNLRKHGRFDQSLTRYTPNQIDAIERSDRVATARKFLELCQDQVAQELRLVQVEQEQQVLKEQIFEVDAKADTAIATADSAIHISKATEETIYNRSGYVTVLGYARKLGLIIPLPKLGALGRKFTAVCKQRNLSVYQVDDPRFGMVNTYPESVLAECKDCFLKASA